MRVVALTVVVVLSAATQLHAGAYFELDRITYPDLDRYVLSFGSNTGKISTMEATVYAPKDGRLNDLRPGGVASTFWEGSLTDEAWEMFGLDKHLDSYMMFDPEGMLIVESSIKDSHKFMGLAFTGFVPFTQKDIANIVVPENQGFTLRLGVVIDYKEYGIEFLLEDNSPLSHLQVAFEDYSGQSQGNPTDNWEGQYAINEISFTDGTSFQADCPTCMLDLGRLGFSMPGVTAVNIKPEPASAILFMFAIPAILTRHRVR